MIETYNTTPEAIVDQVDRARSKAKPNRACTTPFPPPSSYSPLPRRLVFRSGFCHDDVLLLYEPVRPFGHLDLFGLSMTFRSRSFVRLGLGVPVDGVLVAVVPVFRAYNAGIFSAKRTDITVQKSRIDLPGTKNIRYRSSDILMASPLRASSLSRSSNSTRFLSTRIVSSIVSHHRSYSTCSPSKEGRLDRESEPFCRVSQGKAIDVGFPLLFRRLYVIGCNVLLGE